jgi:oligo-1,6-glucosidase
MVYGDYQDHSEGDPHIYAYTRTLGGVTWLILLNHSNETNTVSLPDTLSISGKELVLGNYQDIQNLHTMQPHEARIYQL